MVAAWGLDRAASQGMRGGTGVGRAWVLQANPERFDIDAALEALDRIWWRVPQHTGDIHTGDVAILWRSGQEAGVIGVGRLACEPQLHGREPAEELYWRSADDFREDVTQVLVRVRPTPFVSKEQVRALPALAEHLVLRAPMGTVFPLSDAQWEALRPLVAPPPEMGEMSRGNLPPTFGWGQRAKGVLPMPGGYSGYLVSLDKVCAVVSEERPTWAELPARLQQMLQVQATAARLRASFLQRAGIISVEAGVCGLSEWATMWRESGDNRILAALLHGRCQFIGELLAAAREPRSPAELLAVANDRFGMRWDTHTQVANRRGWLQSAGMLSANGDGKLQTTPAGSALLAELSLYPGGMAPGSDIAGAPSARPEAPESDLRPEPTGAVLEALVESLRSTATDSAHPDRFEQAVRDAFEFLGFRAEWLGGPGRTDVLLDALLGRDDSYRVTVDCKTSASGSVGDQQVDWVTLADHKAKHEAQYVALVAPNPSGSRLFERAENQRVTIISAEELAGLCSQHAKSPLGLEDYRALFTSGGRVETAMVDEQAEELTRLMVLTRAVCDTVRARSDLFGRLTARDLYLILADNPAADGTSEAELQGLLDTLARPLLGVLDGSPDSGYRVTTSPEVASARLSVLADHLGSMRAGG